jgi:DNA polymerase family A
MTATASVSRPLRKLLAAGPAIYRDGNTLIAGDACPAELLPELEALCLPRISDEDGRAVVALLKEHAGRVRYVLEQEEAVAVVPELMAAEALAFDVETAPLSQYRSPVPIAFTKAGTLRKRQPTIGSAGLALDPYRSRVRLVSVFGGTDTGAVVFDLFKLGWNALTPLWTKSLIAANATFDVRRLMEEAHVAPSVVFDVLRVAALTHGLVGQSVSLASVTRDILNIVLPKGLSTFGEGLINRLNPITSRLHPSFRIGSTIAGRFSCAGPNIQQQPARNKAFRSIFRAPEGSSIISCDFSQIELRTLAQIVRKDLAAFTGQDEETTLDGMFRTGEDIHWQTARRMYLLPDDTVKGEHELLRANAKNANFSLAFGMGLETFYKRLRGDRSELTIVEADAIRQV